MSRLRPSDHVIVIGAGLAGWRFVESLRREGFVGAITLVGEEVHDPYDRPPLSKQILAGKWEPRRAMLATPEQLAASMTTRRIGVRATSLDVATTSVELSDGTRLVGTRVVIATGSRARPLSFASLGPVATLRTLDDAQRLGATLDSLDPGSTVAVIGGGFLGAEMATAMRTRGLRPVVLEAARRPLVSVLGDEVSSWLVSIPERAGVELRTDQRLVDVAPDARGFVVYFVDGSSLAARAVVAAIGSSLELDWLEDSGLALDDGVVVSGDLEAAPRVAAIGDVARFPLESAVGEERVRVEHWQVAIDHAARLARHWTGGAPTPSFMVPYFWSDQYDKKIQMIGHPRAGDDVIQVSGSVEEAKWLALYSRGGGVVTGVVALSSPRALTLSRPLLDERTSLDQALARAPWLS